MPASPTVNPRSPNPAYDAVLTDGVRSYGLRIDPPDIREVPQTPSTLRFTGGGGKFGDWEPGMTHLEQRTWTGGRGQENFDEDNTRFFDGRNLWTLTPNRLISGPLLGLSSGTGIDTAYMPGSQTPFNANVVWLPLLSATRYISAPRNGAAFTADYVMVPIRRIGSPGTLTMEIRADDGSTLPHASTIHQTVTKTVSDVTDFTAELLKFDWSGTQSLSGSTTYHIVVYGASTDSLANHWEVGCDIANSGNFGGKSSNGTTWSQYTSTQPYYLFSVAGDARLRFFELDQALYAVDQCLDGASATNLYINGTRGKATSGTSTSLTDTNQAMGTNAYAGATLKIINGTGVGQTRTITSNTATAFTVPTWDITPGATSEFVVYDTPVWKAVTSHGLGAALVTSVAVTGNLPGVAYFAQGATTMRRMRFDATAGTPIHEFADDVTTDVDLLYTFYDEASKTTQVWGARNSTSVTIFRATAQAWGANLTFGTAISVGSTQFAITGFTDHDGALYVGKEDSIWKVENDVPTRLPVGLASSPHPNNGVAMRSLGFFLFFSYMFSIERSYGTTIDDVGPWRGSGIPAGRTGPISAMTSAFGWLFVAVDAGTSGTSCVMVYDGAGYHEIFRAPAVGLRIRSLYWQANPDGHPKLWIECGRHIWYLDFPKNTLNPLNDASYRYNNESVIVLSTMDMGSARLPKFFKELSALSKNLASGIEIKVDYQKDGDIGGTTWTHLGTIFQSPEDTLPVKVGRCRQIRIRLRLITNVATTPVEVRATDLEGYARTPLKYQYLLRLRERPIQLNRRGQRDVDPDTLFAWLRQAAEGAHNIRMKSRYKSMHNRDIIVEPPSLQREKVTASNAWGGVLTITLRDA